MGEEKSMDDYISRQAAIDTVVAWTVEDRPDIEMPTDLIDRIKNMPSAQPEIIRCKDCKYRDENWRRVSVRWLPCMDVRTGSNWFCGSAERRTDDER